jgi:hypothetical protein
MSDMNDPMRAYTEEEKAQLQEAFEMDPVATMSIIAQAHGQAAFSQAAQLSGSQTENFHQTIATEQLRRAAREIWEQVGVENYDAALPAMNAQLEEDPTFLGEVSQDFNVVKDRLSLLYNNAVKGMDLPNVREQEEKATWDRIKKVPGAGSYADLARSQGR